MIPKDGHVTLKAEDWHWLAGDLFRLTHLFSPLQAQALFEFSLGLPEDSLILEIGAYHGLSTIALALGCKGTRKHVYTIDPFCAKAQDTNDLSAPSYEADFRKNLADWGVCAYVTALVGQSQDYYQDWHRPLGLLFIDGNHFIMDDDRDAFWPHLVSGGRLVMHDFAEARQPWPNGHVIFRNMATWLKS